MKKTDIDSFFRRIDLLKKNQKPAFGKMNANQMVCHCTDQIRLALDTIKATNSRNLTREEIFALANAGETVPTLTGMDQVAGEGTRPTTMEKDIVILKEHIAEFSNLDDNFEYGSHPYFGQLGKEKWTSLTVYHLDHHLKQFNV